MDPNANIAEQREIAAAMIAIADKPEFGGEDGMTEHTRLAERLAELVQALDEWRTKGGFDPYTTPPSYDAEAGADMALKRSFAAYLDALTKADPDDSNHAIDLEIRQAEVEAAMRVLKFEIRK